MTFGSGAADLLPGAHNAVNVCLAIRPGERVALVADEASRAVAASLEQALREAGADVQGLLIESIAKRPIVAAPEKVLTPVATVDAGMM